MIKAKDAVDAARALLGTPYGEMDCIALIRTVIRRCAGGEKNYRCEGTNWLWRSIGNSGKYRHLIWQQEGIAGARAGMLVFKRRGDDVHHVGLATECGTVIHASSVSGCVVETELDASWDLLGRHRQIQPGEEAEAAQEGIEAEGQSEQACEMGAVIELTDSVGNVWRPVGGFTMRMYQKGND